MKDPVANAERRGLPRWLMPVLGYLLSLACLIWVYRGFDWRTELVRIALTNWWWVTLAVVFDVAVYFCQGWRWMLLLRPIAAVSWLRSVQAIFIGLFTNEILPLRAGELVRCYLMRRWSRIPFSVVLSSAVVERLFDGIWLLIGFLVVSTFVTLPQYLVEGSRILGILLVSVAVVLGVVMFQKHRAHVAVSKSRWAKTLWHIVEALHAMGNSRSFYAAAFVSLIYLVGQILPVYALSRGYGLDLTFGQIAVVLVILRLGTVPPLAPGNVGSFQAAAKLGLLLFGVDDSVATGFATFAFLVVTLPLWLGGFVALAFTRMKLGDIHLKAQRQMAAAESSGARSDADK